MSSNQVDLSSDHRDSQNYVRDTPANQELVDESQTSTFSKITLQEVRLALHRMFIRFSSSAIVTLFCSQGISAAYEAIQATKAGLTKTKKKRTLVKEASVPSASGAAPGVKPANLQGKDKQGGMDARVPKAWVPLAKADRPKSPPTDETFAALEKLKRIFRQKMYWKIFYEEGGTALQNIVHLGDMKGKRPIAFKRVKGVKKVDSYPHLASKTIPTPRSLPIMVKPNSSSLPPSTTDLPYEPLSPSLAEKRPSERAVSQGKEKRARAASKLSDPPKGGIPPPPFPSCDPLLAAWFFTIEFLTPPYTIPGGQNVCEGTPFKSNLQYFHAVRPLLLEGLCQGYSNTRDPLEVYWDMCRHLIQVLSPSSVLNFVNLFLQSLILFFLS
ncbi:hypothetical protein LIER_31581 [Lithospermum erythrorhizon]|uniref:Uncharacterized protein n=1 Tax=Lithospermum erythrorhizon TaxID=34254 RepID=A0AAV3RRF0_LITER